MCSPVASGDVASIVLMRTMVRLRRFSSEPTRAARSAIDGSCPSSRRSASRAASSSRRWRRTPRGQASLRSASIIAPRTRRSAKVSNLMPRSSSNRCAASIRPSTPSCTRSPMSIEFGIDAAMRRASASTNGKPGNDPAVLTGGDGLGAHESPRQDATSVGSLPFSSLPAAARYRNGGTNGRGRVPVQRTQAV